MHVILQFTPNLQFTPILQFTTLYIWLTIIDICITSTNASQLYNATSLLDCRSRLMMYSEEDDDSGDAKWRGREIIGISPRVGGSSRFSPRRTVAKRGFSDTRTDQFCLCLSLILQLSHDWSSFTLEITQRMLLTRQTAREDFVWKVRCTTCWKLGVTLLMLLTIWVWHSRDALLSLFVQRYFHPLPVISSRRVPYVISCVSQEIINISRGEYMRG